MLSNIWIIIWLIIMINRLIWNTQRRIINYLLAGPSTFNLNSNVTVISVASVCSTSVNSVKHCFLPLPGLYWPCFVFVVFSMALLFHSKRSHSAHVECQAFECTDYDVQTCELTQVAYCQSRATISQYVHIKGKGGKKSHGNRKEGLGNGSIHAVFLEC